MDNKSAFDTLAKKLAKAGSAGYADDAVIGDSIGLYDSDTDETLRIEKRHVLTVDGEPLSLLYTTAKRGRICLQFLIWGTKAAPDGDAKAHLIDAQMAWIAESKRQWALRYPCAALASTDGRER